MLHYKEAQGKTPTLSFRDYRKRAVQMIDIREAEIGDAVGIAALLTELEYPQIESVVAAKIEQLSEHPDARMLVACEGTSLLGFILCISFRKSHWKGIFAESAISACKVECEARVLGRCWKSGLNPSHEKGIAIASKFIAIRDVDWH
jgi:hypothetical protein